MSTRGVIIDVAEEQTALGHGPAAARQPAHQRYPDLHQPCRRTRNWPTRSRTPSRTWSQSTIPTARSRLCPSPYYDGTELKGEIELAIGGRESLPSVNDESREAISKLAAEALAAIDPVRTQFDHLAGGRVADGDHRESSATTCAFPALRALGNIQPEGIMDRITEVYMTQMTDAPNALAPLPQVPETRAAFLYCIGKIDAHETQRGNLAGGFACR